MRIHESEIEVVADLDALGSRCAEEFVRIAAGAVDRSGSCTVCLSGGSTPVGLYSLLADAALPYKSLVPWDHVHLFWGDERHVPPDHPESNYRMVRRYLLSNVPVPAGNIHRIPAENPDAAAAAREYEAILINAFGLSPGQFPRFDLVLLGMGKDGHTASLFPGAFDLLGEGRLVTAHFVDKVHMQRISLTVPVFNNALQVIFMVSGAEKAEALKAVIGGDFTPERLPAQAVRPSHGKLLWMVDEAAARLLE